MVNNNIVNSQYIYINSVNRGVNDSVCDLTVELPEGMIRCNQETESLSIVATHFNITKNWYYINSNNNYLRILNSDGILAFEHYVTPSNYTFKKLASYITNVVTFAITMSWDSNRNKYIIDMPDGYKLDFRTDNSMYYILGFDKGSLITKAVGQSIISPNILNVYLSHNIDVYLENVSPDKNVSAIENSSNNTAKPSQCVLTLTNDFPPYTTLNFDNQDNWFRLNIKEKFLNKLRITIRDEYKNLMNFITDYNLVLKIETYSNDNSMENKKLTALQSIEDYLRLNFVSNNINKV